MPLRTERPPFASDCVIVIQARFAGLACCLCIAAALLHIMALKAEPPTDNLSEGGVTEMGLGQPGGCSESFSCSGPAGAEDASAVSSPHTFKSLIIAMLRSCPQHLGKQVLVRHWWSERSGRLCTCSGHRQWNGRRYH